MKIRDVLSIAGAFCTAFGSVVMLKATAPWGWWTGQAMAILGPLLMGSRAMTSKQR